MKKIKTAICLFSFALISVICSFPASSQGFEISSGETLVLPMTASQSTFVEFIPEVSGKYYFTSVSECDTLCTLYDENMTELASDDDSGETSNFYITYYFKANCRYIFSVKYYSEKTDFDLTVTLAVTETDSSHTHSFVKSVKKKATCTQEGINEFTCKCGKKYEEKVTKLSCKYKTAKEVKPTCTSDGYTLKICTLCKKEVKETAKKKGHSFSEKYTTDLPSTCTKSGSVSRHCIRCDKKTDVKKTEKLGHKYSDKFTTDKKSTTEYHGEKSRHCVRCNAKTDKATIGKIVSVKLSFYSCNYNGKNHKPIFTVKDSKGKTLKAGTDYTVTYTKSTKEIGSYVVKLHFKGNYEGYVRHRFNVLPKKVTGISAVVSKNSITLKWNKQCGNVKYRVYKLNPKTKRFDVLKTLSVNSYTVKNLQSGTDYIFAVRAVKTVSGKDYLSAEGTRKKTATVPEKVTLRSAAGSRKAVLSWNETACDGYIIYMYNEKSQKFEKIKTVKDEDITKYEKTNLARGKTYRFKIRTYKKAQSTTLYSPFSNEASVRTY